MAKTDNWQVFHGDGKVRAKLEDWPPSPPWLKAEQAENRLGVLNLPAEENPHYVCTPEIVHAVNAAIYLRKPLLVEGKPGVGKSTLASAIAFELELGQVLRWPITSRSTFRDALYQYDALGRLQELQALQLSGKSTVDLDIGSYFKLGALGTAFLPDLPRPRVLLIDEIDKSDPDLPNELLDIVEHGAYEIPELLTIGKDKIRINRHDKDMEVDLTGASVQCNRLPIIVITSNGDRVLPAPFLRRCIRLTIREPESGHLANIVEAHFDAATQPGKSLYRFAERHKKLKGDLNAIIEFFVSWRDTKHYVSIDQLLGLYQILLQDVRQPGDLSIGDDPFLKSVLSQQP
jgi:MoxR-like ATPase